MDPNAALQELRELAESVRKDFEADQISAVDCDRMAELFQALDSWIVGRGFLPSTWKGKA